RMVLGRIDQDVRGLEVAVDDAALVRVLKCESNLPHERCRAARRQGTIAQNAREAWSGDKIHRQKMLSPVQTDCANREDAWMAQASRGDRLGAQTKGNVRSAQSAERQQLHRNEPVQADLAG